MKPRPNRYLWTKGDIARLTGLSVDTVERYEREWGLKRIMIGTFCVRYSRADTIEALKRLGFDVSDVDKRLGITFFGER